MGRIFPQIKGYSRVLLHDLDESAALRGGSRLVDRPARDPASTSCARGVEIAIAFLSGEPRRGSESARPSAMRDARPLASAASPALQLIEVDDVFERIAATAGRGSPADRVRMLRELLARATGDEQDFLIRLLFGELRQGALEAVLLEAVARASNVSPGAVRRAVMLAGS
jgi:DNA ligase-1